MILFVVGKLNIHVEKSKNLKKKTNLDVLKDDSQLTR
jgi:hypothetical protein